MDLEQEPSFAPLFCLETTDSITGHILFINFRASNLVEEPKPDIDEDELIEAIRNPSPRIEQFKVPLRLGQIYWREVDQETRSDYVIDADLNDKFAFRRVIVSEVIRHYVITVTLSCIESKFNDRGYRKTLKQYINHELKLDQTNYTVHEDKLQVEKSNQIVNNRIVLVDSAQPGKERVRPVAHSEPTTKNPADSEQGYDLYLRPKSQILTCCIHTDVCPDSVSFNDDRIVVELNGKTLMDVFLPFSVDLGEPAKYKYDDRTCLFRLVFKVKDL